MTRKFVYLFLSMLPALGCVAHSGLPSDQELARKLDSPSSRRETVRRILPRNVRLLISDGDTVRRTASGVSVGNEIGPEGPLSYILTNAHAVSTEGLAQPKLEVLVEGSGKAKRYTAQAVASGKAPHMDLALLKIDGVALPAAQLANEDELEVGDDVIVAAAPYGKSISISGGMISHLERDPESAEPIGLKTDAPIGYGASGGGIYLVSSGKLAALVEGYRTAKIGFAVADQPYSFDVPMPGETFAAPSTKVRAFLKAKGYEHILSGGAFSPAQAALQ